MKSQLKMPVHTLDKEEHKRSHLCGRRMKEPITDPMRSTARRAGSLIAKERRSRYLIPIG